MKEMFNERKALQITLHSLLEQRVVLRRQYVDQDKQLGSEIKEILSRIRELDTEEGFDGSEYAEEAATAAEEMLPGDLIKQMKMRKAHIRHDYVEVAGHIERILRESVKPLSLSELCEVLKHRHNVEFSSSYIGVQKALKHVKQVKVEKDGRKLIFSL